VLGTREDYPTEKLAQRELDEQLKTVNSLTYKPTPTATFSEFATRWERDILILLKPSTGSADRSRIRKHLLPELGNVSMKDVNTALVQAMIARKRKQLAAKSIKNLIALMRQMWTQAEAWGFVQHSPFRSLVLPERDLLNERFLSLSEMQCIIETAVEPFKTYCWILAETGLRAGEIGALPVRNVLLEQGAIRISQNVWHGKIQTVKSLKGNRLVEISPQLVEHLREYLRHWKPNRLGLLFTSKNSTPWDTDTLRKRRLYPLLEKLGIERCGFHAFRHGNETVMDGEGVPMATRQNRLGHSDARTTMKYTHVISEDGRKIAARFGELLTSSPMVTMAGGNA
jgi:integrase